MGKYRGADGWLHDDSVGNPSRYESKDNTRPRETAEGPQTVCPNCGLEIGWRCEKGYCNRCNWGKEKSEGPGLACCFGLAVYVICPLVAMGMGYGVSGFGGLLAGLGIGLAIPTGIFLLAAAVNHKDTND